MVDVRSNRKENQPPVAKTSLLKGLKIISSYFELVASDPNGDTLSYEIIGEPKNGDITGNAPT